MSDNLGVLRIAKKAGRLVVGEESAGIAVHSRKARLILTAADASPRTQRRAEALADIGGTLHLTLPDTKEALGAALGKNSCAILVFTDIGLSSCFVKKLAAIDPLRYGEAEQVLAQQAKRAQLRKRVKHEKQKKLGKTGMRRSNNG